MTMLRFTIRDLLWLMGVVGVCLGWWGQYDKTAEVRKYAEKLGAT